MTSITIKLDRALREELREVCDRDPQDFISGGQELFRVLKEAFPVYHDFSTKQSLARDFSTATFYRD
jgi:hypothetical protein